MEIAEQGIATAKRETPLLTPILDSDIVTLISDRSDPGCANLNPEHSLGPARQLQAAGGVVQAEQAQTTPVAELPDGFDRRSGHERLEDWPRVRECSGVAQHLAERLQRLARQGQPAERDAVKAHHELFVDKLGAPRASAKIFDVPDWMDSMEVAQGDSKESKVGEALASIANGFHCLDL